MNRPTQQEAIGVRARLDKLIEHDLLGGDENSALAMQAGEIIGHYSNATEVIRLLTEWIESEPVPIPYHLSVALDRLNGAKRRAAQTQGAG